MFKSIILIPSYNEKKSLKNILNKIDSKFKVIVVDDCSDDGTCQYLKKKKIEFIKNKTNIGYESTLKKGMIYIKKNYKKCNIVITFDADGEHKVSDLKKLL
jgi:glycosyltransferase involved in cell wall biosynthesis